jgi:chitodextrinase
LAGKTRGLVFRDAGLLPNTTYYYKVAAVDASGNIGPVSAATAATTKDTSLKPMIIESMDVTHTETNAKVTLRVVDKETRQGIAAAVHGHFTYGAGKYISGNTSPDGVMTEASESVAEDIEVGFEPRGIAADGYYWAQAYDNRQPVSSGGLLNR